MIESIIIKDIASFDETGINLIDLQKVNFIYGENGSGKTTISKLLFQPNIYPKNITIGWKGLLPIKTLVYNKDFRRNNFRKGKINGVFTLGQATQEEIDNIESKKKESTELKDSILKKRNTLDAQINKKESKEDDFKEEVWKIYKQYVPQFKEAFLGFQKKDTFKSQLLKVHESKKGGVLLIRELEEKANIIFGNTPSEIDLISIIDFSELTIIEENPIWKKKILGKTDVGISSLIQHLNINDWVNEGRDYLQEGEICPFCQQQTITDNFRTQLNDYFDLTFLNDTNDVQELKQQYFVLLSSIINELHKIEEIEKLNSETKLDLTDFSEKLKTIESIQSINKELVNAKIKEPSRIIDLKSTQEVVSMISIIIENTNNEIKKHNSIVVNFSKERNELIRNIWIYLVEANKDIIDTNIRSITGIQKGIDNLNKEISDLEKKYSELDKAIKELSKNVTSTQPAIDEINRILGIYGFKSFTIVPSPEINQYQIQRENGDIVESSLSEGEVTFISFLYFLQHVKGGETEEVVNEDRIVVIDDPISSLDSNVLFVVSSLLKEIIKDIKNNVGNIKQIITFTHNVYFHKEISYIDGRSSDKKGNKPYFWVLRKNRKTSIQSYNEKNPIQNSYELLWQEIQNREKISCVTVQNIMRRIIENYFKILGKYGDDDIIQKFETKEEQEICRSLLCWINDGSHCIPDDLYIEQSDLTIDSYYSVFQRIFEKMGHVEHYNMMIKNNIN